MCHVVSVTDPYGRIIAFLDRSRYYFFQAASPDRLFASEIKNSNFEKTDSHFCQFS
jgi:hypothetical protein